MHQWWWRSVPINCLESWIYQEESPLAAVPVWHWTARLIRQLWILSKKRCIRASERLFGTCYIYARDMHGVSMYHAYRQSYQATLCMHVHLKQISNLQFTLLIIFPWATGVSTTAVSDYEHALPSDVQRRSTLGSCVGHSPWECTTQQRQWCCIRVLLTVIVFWLQATLAAVTSILRKALAPELVLNSASASSEPPLVTELATEGGE